ncbi:DUF2934 domain-containing protein [Granulicella sp. dw_53]|uniref:DUF2934 domain-containing protein n=1 Tax=Granulicella sp. dw_53 TaxID=2719792 RepID=UPI001BD2622D|nr:DUF2934 domain-containing protein [Granulicella sp. dw_53]
MAETVKKPKAPAKTKTPAEAKAPVAVKAKAVKKTAEAKAAPPSHDEIARLAQKYWEERGWQDGYAEQDWLRAEQELRAS